MEIRNGTITKEDNAETPGIKRAGRIARVSALMLVTSATMTIFPLSAHAEDKVAITATGPEGWVSAEAEVNVSVEIPKDSGIEIKSVEAKEGNGKWTDITDTYKYVARDNGKVTIRVKDQEGKTYEESIELNCFDKEIPTLIAAVNNGTLHIQAQDGLSGIKNVYVNGYTFPDVPGGDLTIRLQQFDATYAEFKIQAMDAAGNLSDVYSVVNPYVSEDDEDLVHYLPTLAIPTDEEHSMGTVIEYANEDLTLTGDEMFEDLDDYREGNTDEDGEPLPLGKEIYTIETPSGKTFYMVIDKEKDENNAYLLTQAGEADILNFVQDDDEKVLPQNAAVVSEHSLTVGEKPGSAKTPKEDEEPAEETAPKPEKKVGNKNLVIVGGVVALIGGAAAYMKLVKGRSRKNHDDEDEDDDDYGEITQEKMEKD